MPQPAKRGKRTYEVIDLTGSSPPPKKIASSLTAHRAPTSSDRETWSSQPTFQHSLPSTRMLRTEDRDGEDLDILDLTQDDETNAWEVYGTLGMLLGSSSGIPLNFTNTFRRHDCRSPIL